MRIGLVVLLAWLGLDVSLVLAYRHAHPASRAFCDPGSGCDRALSSAYSEFAGIPLAYVGIAGFAAMAVLYLVAYGARDGSLRRSALRIGGVASCLGALASGGLLYVQFGVLKVFCPLCTASAVLAVGIYFIQVRLARERGGSAHPGRAGAFALALVITTLLGATLFVLDRRGRVVARIDGEEITDEDLGVRMQIPLHGIEARTYQLKKTWIDQRAADRALAAEAGARGVTVDDLLTATLDAVPEPTPSEIDVWLEQNSPVLSDAERRARARHAILTARRDQRRRDLVAERRAKQHVEFLLDPPRLPHLDIDEKGGRTEGPPGAPVHLVVFSDFECPFCSDLSRTIRRMRDKYPAQVSSTFFHNPLETHPHAEAAALAAECAQEQGKFREFHDRLFAAKSPLDDALFLAIATSLDLDLEKWKACRSSDRGRATLRAHHREAEKLGIESVPSLFLNGRLVGGNIEPADLERMVEEEIRGPWRALGGSGK